MFHKDTVRLIKKTFNRFFSLLMIVLIGSAFMMGLLSTRPIMEDNVDRYADEESLQDIQFYSAYGFCDEDIDAIREQECVEEVFASRFRDVYSLSSAGNVRVTRVEEAERSLDRFELIEGRMPESPDEALVLDSGMTKGEYSTGEHLSLFLEDDDISEILSGTEYTIVGVVKTSSYMAKTLGTGTLKNLDLEMVIYVPAENFISEYYTTVYATVSGARGLETFGSDYKALIAEAKDDLEGFARKQQDYLKDTLLAEYKDKIAEGEAELEEKRAEGQQELDDAKKQLDDANIQIISSEAQISTLEATLNTLLSRQRSLEKQYGENSKTTADRIAQIESDSGLSFDEYYTAVLADYGTYTAMSSLIEQADTALIRDQLERTRAQLDGKYEGGVEAAYQEVDKLYRDRIYYDALDEEIRLAKEAEGRARREIASMRYQVRNGREEYEKGLEDYNKGLIEFNTEIEKAELDIRKAYQELEELPDAQWMVLDRESHYSTYMYQNNTKQMGAIGISLPFLFFLVAALVCLTTMTRLVDEQRGQIGIFRALGFSRGQIVGKYVGYALLASFIGSILGIFVGMAIFPVVIYETWRLMYDLPTLNMFIPLSYAAVSIFSFAVLIAVVTAYVVNKTLKEMPSQLMRPKPPKNARKVFLEKIPFIWNRLSFTFRITARNLIRYKARALMTIIGVAGCTGLLVVGWGIKDSISDIVAIQFGEIYNYDYTVNMDSDANIDEIIETLKKDDTNEGVAPYMTYASKVYVNGKEPTINV
ncbi:MAG: ABC transporter permease, partial [Firmicutes bacterium]|nr:ABC transporter permease [Bacillota bacterium]